MRVIAYLVLGFCLLSAGDLAAQEKASAPRPAITLRPGDVLRIRIWPDSGLGGEFAIAENGKAALPLAGDVDVAGKSIDEIRRLLQELYAREMKTPAVNVTPLFQVTILGAVERPGLYLIDPTKTLFDVVGLAGGFTRDAREAKVRILRESGVVELDAKKVLKEGGANLNLSMMPGDRVIVPESHGFSAQSVFFVIQSVVVITTLLTRN